MKNLKLIRIFAVLFVALSFSSCVDDSDYSIPTVGPDNTYTNLVPLSDIVSMYNGSIVDFNEYITNSGIADINTYGYVVSNDRAGNFFKTIIIQDKPENPTVGLEIRVDATDLGAMYNVGRKVYIKLKGLALDKRYDTYYQIGVKNDAGNGIDRIGAEVFTDYIERSSELATMVPKVLTIDQITDQYIYTLVQFDDMQSEEEGQKFADENSTYSQNRNLKNCATDETIVMRTSGYASFKSLQIPTGRGSVKAILNRFQSTYQIFVNDLTDFSFDQDRCKPLFEENFESFSTGDISQVWTNYLEAGSKSWNVFSDSNSLGLSARMGAYKSGDASNIAWLISPAINLDNTPMETLTFKTSNSFADGSELEVLISTDWDGTEANVTSATWTTLPATIVSDNEFYKNWVSSGDVDLSSYAGTAYIAFKYTGSGQSGSDGTYEVDDIIIK